MIGTSIEQTMQAQHLAVRERLGMGVKTRQAIPLRISPPAVPEPSYKVLVTPQTKIANPDASWREIVKEVIDKHGVNMRDFMGIGRSRSFIAARKEAAWRLMNERGMSFPSIAKRLGYECHTSILHLVNEYAKEIGEAPRNSKEVTDKARSERNTNIMRRLHEGAFVAELSREYKISTTAIRAIANSLGFDFSEGADTRAAKASRARAEANRLERKEKAAAERAAKDELIAKRDRRQKALIQSLAEQYYSFNEAASATGMPISTIRTRALRHGVIFRNTAIAMPLKGSK